MSGSRSIVELLEALRSAPDDEARQSVIAGAPGRWQPCLFDLTRGPDPSGALVRAEGLPSSILERGPFTPALVRLLHQGGYPARMLQADPTAIDLLDEPAPGFEFDDIEVASERLARALGRGDPATELGRARTRGYLHLTRREVEGAPLEEVGTGLCRLATVCIDALLRHLDLHEHVVTFGMGKLGGGELNFLSDIDLIFVHADELGCPPEQERATVVALHDRLRTLVRLLEGQGRFRPLFRVDLRLRPFGAKGPLSMSVQATESYYERYGRDWERQAWLRARPLAGNLALGHLLMKRLTPFVYRRSVTPAIFGEIRELMARARRDAGTSRDALDLKLDPGGIREVEFSVQALQLLHGGRNAQLRTRSTLRALDRLFAAGLVSDHEHRSLVEAYRHLRRIEHRLQLAEGQQTHRLPRERVDRVLLAARLSDVQVRIGPSSEDMQENDPLLVPLLDAFERRLARHRADVSAVAHSIGGEPEAEASIPGVVDRGRARATVLDLGAPAHLRLEALSDLGVRDPEEADAMIRHLASRTDGPFSARGAARAGAEALLLACLDAADPDTALTRLVEFAAPRPAHYGIWRVLAEPAVAGRDLVRLTAELFATSEPLSAGLIGFPIAGGHLRDESIGLLLGADLDRLPDAARIAADLAEHPIDPRGLGPTLLKFKHAQLVSIGLHDLGHRPDPLAVGHALSLLADIIVRMLLRDLAAEFGQQARARGLTLGVFALGKYGMQAMDYGSDLDLMFVFDAEGEATRSRQSEAVRFGQALLGRLQQRILGMRLYEVDMRLRPSGRQGLLVSSLPAFARYHDRSLPVWERLALLRLRPVAEVTLAGDLTRPLDTNASEEARTRCAAALPGALCEKVADIVEQSLDRSGDDPPDRLAVATEVRTLKRRIERELARENRKSGYFNAKTGRGGILELELLVSALVLIHRPSNPSLKSQSSRLGIIESLQALADAAVLPSEEAGALGAAYRFQRLLLNRLRMTSRGGIDDPDRFAQNSPRLTTLARRMGLPTRDALLDQFFSTREVVRSAFARHLDS